MPESSLHFKNSSKQEIDEFIESTQIIDDKGEPLVVWHGSRINALTQFDFANEGSGVVSTSSKKYGGFFFGSSKSGVSYYSNGGIPEEKIDESKGQIDVVVYGEGPYYFNVQQRDDSAYNNKYNALIEKYKNIHGEAFDEDRMPVDIEDEFDDIGNGGPYLTWEEADAAGYAILEETNICCEKGIDPFIYPIHLKINKLYIHNPEDGFFSPPELIKKVKALDEGYTGLKMIDICDGDTYMDVYVAFDVSSIMILDKLNPESCGIKKTNKIPSTLIENSPSESTNITPAQK